VQGTKLTGETLLSVSKKSVNHLWFTKTYTSCIFRTNKMQRRSQRNY